MIEIWLVIVIFLDGEPHKLIDEKQADIAMCWQHAAEQMDRVLKINDNFEFSVACHLVRRQDDPA